MITEQVQILSTNLRLSGVEVGMRATHVNHPCTIWARQSRENAIWLMDLTYALGEEYLSRYTRGYHKSLEVLKTLPILQAPARGLTPFTQAFAEVYRCEDPVEGYRKYYCHEKHFATWKHGEVPDWFKKLPSLIS
jgi:hypothetical protein